MRSIVYLSILALSVGCVESNSVAPPPVEIAVPAETTPPSALTAAPAEESAAAAPAAQSSAAAPATENGGSNESASAAATPVPIESGVVTLSPENTRIQFVGTHVGPKPDPRTGVFTKFSGKLELDPATKVPKSVTVDIKTESLETPIPKLTNHLRSPDFFDAREFPAAKFQSKSIVPAEGEGNFLISGSLTLLKATKELKIPAKVTVTDKGLALVAEFTIDRTEFGMSGLQDRVNKEVPMKVSIGQPTAAK